MFKCAWHFGLILSSWSSPSYLGILQTFLPYERSLKFFSQLQLFCHFHCWTQFIDIDETFPASFSSKKKIISGPFRKISPIFRNSGKQDTWILRIYFSTRYPPHFTTNFTVFGSYSSELFNGTTTCYSIETGVSFIVFLFALCFTKDNGVERLLMCHLIVWLRRDWEE